MITNGFWIKINLSASPKIAARAPSLHLTFNYELGDTLTVNLQCTHDPLYDGNVSL
jgi:hypothetical protein